MRAAEEAEEARRDGPEETGEAKGASAGGHWPSAPDQQAALLVELDRVERLRLERLEHDALRRARIVDRATEVLLRRLRRGTLPEHPRAWFRTVVDRFTKSGKIPYAAKILRLDLILDMALAPERADPERQRLRSAQVAWLRENQKNLGLSERERAVLGAIFNHGSNRAAAKSLGMGASNFRRQLGKLIGKIGPEIRARFGENDPDADPPPPLKGRARLCCRDAQGRTSPDLACQAFE